MYTRNSSLLLQLWEKGVSKYYDGAKATICTAVEHGHSEKEPLNKGHTSKVPNVQFPIVPNAPLTSEEMTAPSN